MQRGMKKLFAIVLSLLLAVPMAHAELVFGPDSFTAGSNINIDAYPSGSANYTYSVGSSANLLVNATSDLIVVQDNIGADGIAIVTSPDLSSLGDQEARAVVSGTAAALAGSWAGVTIRDDGSGDAYLAGIDNGNNEVAIYEIIAGATSLLASADRGLAGATKYSMWFSAVGSSLTLRLNGDTAVTVTDATRSTGSPGVYGGDDGAAGTAGEIDDFEVDDLATGIFVVGVGAQAIQTANGNSVACAYPAGYTAVANDVGVVVMVGRPTDTSDIAAPTDYTQIGTSLREVGANDLRIQTFRKLLTASEAAPTVTVTAPYSGASGGVSCQMLVLRGVNTTTPEDAASVASDAAAAATFTPTGITTATNNAHVVAVVASADDNALRMSTFQNFTARIGGATYDTTTGGDLAVAVGTKQQVSLGAVTAPSWTQALVGTDAWAGVVMALRKLGEGGEGAACSGGLMMMGVGC